MRIHEKEPVSKRDAHEDALVHRLTEDISGGAKFSCVLLSKRNLFWTSKIFAGFVDASGLWKVLQCHDQDRKYTDYLIKREAGRNYNFRDMQTNGVLVGQIWMNAKS